MDRKEYQREYKRQRRLDNIEKCREYDREWKKKAYATPEGKLKKAIADKKSRDKHKERYNATRRLWSNNVRLQFLDLYGAFCHCKGCGITEEVFLTIEHVNGQIGKRKEGGEKAYRRAIKTFPNPEYTVLCMNCNTARRFGRICPHEQHNEESRTV